jgi:hypothetical protein
MNAANAELLLYAITAVAVVVWVEGLRFLTATIRKEKKGGEEFAKADDPAPAGVIYGSAELQGRAADLSAKAAAVMAARSIKICEKTDESIVFETPIGFMPGSNFNLPPLSGQMRFTPQSDRSTRVDYAMAKPSVRALLISGFVFQALGLIAIVAGFLVIYFVVIPSQNPGVRWQTVQMVQTVHFLWPPFFFASSYRRSASFVRVQFDTFIHNLPFLTE